MRFIPVYSPALAPADALAVKTTVEHGFISWNAPVVRAFESSWSGRCGMAGAVAVSSGTAALELAVSALGLGPGDEVLCPALTIISCARAIVLAGATPVLVDVEPGTWCLDVEHAERRVTPRTRALLGVHLFGHPYRHDAVASLAALRDLAVIEDAAQAHGASVHVGGTRLPCGGLGDVACLSFYANKAVTTGEGGMVLCRDAALVERVRDLSNLSFGKEARFRHDELGHNYRMSALQAALGQSQLERLDETVRTKRRLAQMYAHRLEALGDWTPQEIASGAEPSPWMIAGVLGDGVRAKAVDVAAALARRGVETRPFFVGMHEQPAFLEQGYFRGERYPVTERLSERGLYLPSGHDLDEEAVDYVANALAESIAEVGRASRSAPGAHPVIEHDDAEPKHPFGALYADAYDGLYADKDYEGETRTLSICFERFAQHPVRRVLDLGCGTGRHAETLVRAGYAVVGVDRSEAMLEIARSRVPAARFVAADIGHVTLDETFDAVVMLFGVLSYQTTVDDLTRTLSNVRRHLVPGGLFITDIWYGVSTASPRRSRRTASVGEVEWVRTGSFSRVPDAQRVDVRFELERREGGRSRVVEELHQMHYFHRFELEFALRAANMDLLRVGTYADVERSPGRDQSSALVVARAS